MDVKNLTAADIVGRYEVVKLMDFNDGDPKLFNADELRAELEKKKASGEIDKESYYEKLNSLNMQIEFTEENTVFSWIRIPDSLTKEDEEEMKKAFSEASDAVEKDGYIRSIIGQWKIQDGVAKLIEDIGSDENNEGSDITFDDDGLLVLAEGFFYLRKIS